MHVPFTKIYNNTNNVYGRVGLPNVVFLGTFNSSNACLSAAVMQGPRVCGSFVWHSSHFPDPSFARHCYATKSTAGSFYYFDWFPTLQMQVVSGRLGWSCDGIDKRECSHNGQCRLGKCECDVGWKGHACEILDVKPVNIKKMGFKSKYQGYNRTSWGGAVIQHSQEWHMWASEIQSGCGMDAWCQNSQIVHAVSRISAGGPYLREEVVFPAFSHEPSIAIDPMSNSIVMFFTAQRPPTRKTCRGCVDGTTENPPCPESSQCNPNTDATWMSFASSPSGPWSEPVVILNGTGSDSNLSPVILGNGSLRALWRSFDPTPSHPWFGSKIHLLSSPDWRDPSQYVADHKNIFPMLSAPTNFGGAEDPFLYQTPDKTWHVILHNMYGCGTGIGSRPCGSHGFARDFYGPWTLSGSGAYGPVILMTDGSQLLATSRERPHLIFDANGSPSHLVTGTGYHADAAFTLVQPLHLPMKRSNAVSDVCDQRTDDVPCLHVPACGQGHAEFGPFFLSVEKENVAANQTTTGKICWFDDGLNISMLAIERHVFSPYTHCNSPVFSHRLVGICNYSLRYLSCIHI